jgi:SAM-dependent methyltransferase
VPRLLSDLLVPGREALPVADGVWSVLQGDRGPARYDRRAAAYDWVVGNAIYNRLAWGASTDRYRAFAARAVSSGAGPFLDAGSGSAVFTAESYARAERPVVLVDRSRNMLAVAGERLRRAAGGMLPAHIVLLQADVLDLPFRPGAFGTALSMGMLHLFADEDVLLLMRKLVAILSPESSLFLSSLVAERAIGRCYLALLHRAGEVATPRSFDRLSSMLAAELDGSAEFARDGSMAYIAAMNGGSSS